MGARSKNARASPALFLSNRTYTRLGRSQYNEQLAEVRYGFNSFPARGTVCPHLFSSFTVSHNANRTRTHLNLPGYRVFLSHWKETHAMFLSHSLWNVLDHSFRRFGVELFNQRVFIRLSFSRVIRLADNFDRRVALNLRFDDHIRAWDASLRRFEQAFFELVDFNNLRLELFKIRDNFTRGLTFISATFIPRVYNAIFLVNSLKLSAVRVFWVRIVTICRAHIDKIAHV